MSEVVETFGSVDIVVNNAAVYPMYELFEEADFREIEGYFHRTYDVNVVGLARMVHIALPQLKDSPSGRIINIASVGFHVGWPEYLEAYIASKGAVVALTRVYAKAVGKYGITCNAIAPGSFPTRR